MSLAVNDRRVDFIGNDVTTSFSFDFKIFDKTYVQVIATNDTTEVETVLTLDVDYTVSGVGSASGGLVELIEADQAWMTDGGGLKTGYTLTIVGATPLTQTTDIRNQGPYYPSLHEDAFDKLTMIVQELGQKIRRAPLFSFLAGVGDKVFPNPDPGKAIIWGPTGQLENTEVDINAIDQAVTDTTASAAAAAASEAASAASQSAAAASALAAASYVGAAINFQDYGSVLNANLTIPSNATYSLIRVNSPAASRTITLPAANAFTAGRFFAVWDEGANSGGWPITVQRAGSDTIEGATSFSINKANMLRIFTTNGSNRWSVNSLKQQEVLDTMLNDGAVTTNKILNSAVTTAKIADSNVTTAKLADANVTKPKLAALGQQISTSSGNDVINSTTQDIDNLSVTLTTTGRPVFIGLVSDGSASLSRLLITRSANSASAEFYFLEGSTIIARQGFSAVAVGATTVTFTIPTSALWHIYVPVAGTYTYKVQGSTAASAINADYIKLVAFEL